MFLTKGDNNGLDDTALYPEGKRFLVREDIIGSVVAYVPVIGYPVVLIHEQLWLKVVLVVLGYLMTLLEDTTG